MNDLLTDEWKRGHLLERLAALQQENYQRDLDRRIAVELLDSAQGAAREEAAGMVAAAKEAQRFLATAHRVLKAELDRIAEADDGDERRSLPG